MKFVILAVLLFISSTFSARVIFEDVDVTWSSNNFIFIDCSVRVYYDAGEEPISFMMMTAEVRDNSNTKVTSGTRIEDILLGHEFKLTGWPVAAICTNHGPYTVDLAAKTVLTGNVLGHANVADIFCDNQ